MVQRICLLTFDKLLVPAITGDCPCFKLNLIGPGVLGASRLAVVCELEHWLTTGPRAVVVVVTYGEGDTVTGLASVTGTD